MSKISDLPNAAELSGSEVIPIVQAGATRKSAIGPLVQTLAQPYVDDAQAAAEEAAGSAAVGGAALQLPPSRFPYKRAARYDLALDVYGSYLGTAAGGTATANTAFARAGIAYEIDGSSYTSYQAGNVARLRNGVAIRPALTNLTRFAQNCAVAPWSAVGIASRVADGLSILGVARQLVTLDASNGQHRLTQAAQPVTAGQQVTAVSNFKPVAGLTQFGLSLSGTPFTAAPIALLDIVTGQVSAGAGSYDAAGAYQEADGSWTLWVSKTVTTTGNASSSLYAYKAGQASFVGAGETFYFCSLNLVTAARAVPPMLNNANATSARLGDVLSIALTGTAHSVLVELVSDATMLPGGYIASFSDGTATDQVALVNNGGALRLYANNGGVTQTYDWVAGIGGTDAVAFSYDEASGVVSASINGVPLPTVTLASKPSGITRVNIGSDAVGANQINAVVRYVEVAATALTTSDLVLATKANAATFNPIEVLFTGDGASGAFIYTPAANSADGKDYIRWHMNLRDNPTQKAYGLATNAAYTCRRTGDRTFILGTQLLDENPAQDDSLFRNGAPNAGNFLAILAGATNHGFLVQTAAKWLVDGRVVTPTVGVWVSGRTVQLFQDCDGYIPTAPASDASTVFMRRRARFQWSADRLRYRPRWTFLSASTIAAGSYPAALSTNGRGFTLCTFLENTYPIAPGSVANPVTTHPWMQISNAAHFVSMEITAGFDPLDDILFMQASDASTAKGKVYYKPWSTDRVVAANDTFEWEITYRAGLAG